MAETKKRSNEAHTTTQRKVYEELFRVTYELVVTYEEQRIPDRKVRRWFKVAFETIAALGSLTKIGYALRKILKALKGEHAP